MLLSSDHFFLITWESHACQCWQLILLQYPSMTSVDILDKNLHDHQNDRILYIMLSLGLPGLRLWMRYSDNWTHFHILLTPSRWFSSFCLAAWHMRFQYCGYWVLYYLELVHIQMYRWWTFDMCLPLLGRYYFQDACSISTFSLHHYSFVAIYIFTYSSDSGSTQLPS